MAADPAIRGTTRLAGVIGWPVEHSRSPQMHNAAYAALGLDWAYVPLAVPERRLAAAVRGLAALGFAGANVTIPHKQAAAALCDRLSDEARTAGSVNTLLVGTEGNLRGETTDGRGLLAALGDAPTGDAVVIGAGGAARAAAAALAAAGRRVVLIARRPQAAEAVADELGVEAGTWPAEPAVIVNATPVGQRGSPSVLPLDGERVGPGQVVCDLAYRGDGRTTGLIALAARRGARVVDGLDVLVHQGAIAFELFTGLPAPIDVMRAAARRSP
ncbi:MAG: shikimate dehydrogenase [Gaiellales bacterium]